MYESKERTIFTVTFLDDDNSEEFYSRCETQGMAYKDAILAAKSPKRKNRPVVISRQRQIKEKGGRWINDGSDMLDVIPSGVVPE